MKLINTIAATALAAALIVPTAFAAVTSGGAAPKMHVAAMKKMAKKPMMKKSMMKKPMMKGSKKSMMMKKPMKKMAKPMMKKPAM